MRIRKFNSARGAILCNKCRVIVLEGSEITQEDWDCDDDVFCGYCAKVKVEVIDEVEDEMGD